MRKIDYSTYNNTWCKTNW